MITEISRTLYGVYDYANTQINFESNPYLQATNDLILYFTDNDARYAAKVSSVSGNNAVIDFSNAQYDGWGVVAKTPNYGAGLTGPQEVFSFKFTNPPNAVLQAFSTGGSSNVAIEVSTDQQHWISLATLPITVANSNTAYTTVTTPWPYGRLNITNIGAGNSIAVNKVI
jgi:hypothetical protein